MTKRVYSDLSPVRRRQRLVRGFRSAVIGLLAGSVLGIALGGYRVLTAQPVPIVWVAALLAGGTILGAAAGCFRRASWGAAAEAVDSRYTLKDRALTALDFVSRAGAGPLHELQLDDAAEHLRGVKPGEVAPFSMPRLLPYAVVAAVAAVALVAWPLASSDLQASPSAPLPEVVEVADKLAEDLEELEKLTQEEQDEELKTLLDELRLAVDALKEPGVDTRDALAKLSEMQNAIAAQQAKYNVGLVDGQLASLGEALATAPALEGAGQALQEGKFDKAAKNLEELEKVELTAKEAKALEERMKKVAKQMADAGLGQLSEDVSEFTEGVCEGDASQCKGGAKKIAKAVSSHAARKKIGECLGCQLASLSECKGMCQSNSLARFKKPEKSNSPKQTFGLGTSGNTEGDKTALDSQRNRTDITGQQGEGPSEVETTHSPEGQAVASRGYQEQYQKYQKMSEAVLESERIPLGHRQTIRRYFELIRPENGESAE